LKGVQYRAPIQLGGRPSWQLPSDSNITRWLPTIPKSCHVTSDRHAPLGFSKGHRQPPDFPHTPCQSTARPPPPKFLRTLPEEKAKSVRPIRNQPREPSRVQLPVLEAKTYVHPQMLRELMELRLAISITGSAVDKRRRGRRERVREQFERKECGEGSSRQMIRRIRGIEG